MEFAAREKVMLLDIPRRDRVFLTSQEKLGTKRSGRGEARLLEHDRNEQMINRRAHCDLEPIKTDLRKQLDVACVLGDLELLEATLQKVNRQYNFISESTGLSKATGLYSVGLETIFYIN